MRGVRLTIFSNHGGITPNFKLLGEELTLSTYVNHWKLCQRLSKGQKWNVKWFENIYEKNRAHYDHLKRVKVSAVRNPLKAWLRSKENLSTAELHYEEVFGSIREVYLVKKMFLNILSTV